MKRKKVYRTELTPLRFLERSASVFPDKTAVVYGDRRYTYREFAERVNRLASALRAAGLAKRDRVAFLCPNIPAMLEAHFAVPAAGGILVAINTRSAATRSATSSSHSGAKFLVVDTELAPWSSRSDLAGHARGPRRRHRQRRRSLRGVLAAGSPDPSTGSRTRTRRSPSTTPRAPPAAPRASCTPTAARTSTPGRGARDPHDLRQRLSLDAADVPLQRLVLPLGRDRHRRHPRLPAQARTGPVWRLMRARASPTSAPPRRC